MAAAIHHHFKLPLVTYMCQDGDTMCDVKKRLIEEVVERAKEPQMVPSIPGDVHVNCDETACMWQSPQGAGQTDQADKVEEEFAGWSKIKVAAKERVSSDPFLSKFRDVWVDLFVKYNTPLPSSASVDSSALDRTS